jgi:hypothetical protein
LILYAFTHKVAATQTILYKVRVSASSLPRILQQQLNDET